MFRPKISIVTVCYNAADSLERTILSVINQTYNNIEYIIVDGGSTDGTIDIIKKYEGYIDRWVSEPDKGVYDAMNKSISYLTGEWILFLNSGDLLYSKTTLDFFTKFLNGENTVYYGDVILTPSRVRFGGKINKWKMISKNICHQSIFYPKSVFYHYHYNTRYRLYADWVLNVSIMGNNNYPFSYVNETVAYYNLDGMSVSRDDAAFFRDRFLIIYKSFGFVYLLYAMIRFFFHCMDLRYLEE